MSFLLKRSFLVDGQIVHEDTSLGQVTSLAYVESRCVINGHQIAVRFEFDPPLLPDQVWAEDAEAEA